MRLLVFVVVMCLWFSFRCGLVFGCMIGHGCLLATVVVCLRVVVGLVDVCFCGCLFCFTRFWFWVCCCGLVVFCGGIDLVYDCLCFGIWLFVSLGFIVLLVVLLVVVCG